MEFIIRSLQEDDLQKIDALEERVQPYTAQDEAAVQAMYARATRAKQAQDPRWMDFPDLPPRTLAEEFDAFWVAEGEGENGPTLVGMVGVQAFRAGEVMPASHPLAHDWLERGSVVELRRLRVAPEAREDSLGTRLCLAVIEWCREQGYHTLVVNTTTPQAPALGLYQKLGFQEAGISFIDRYELVWLELIL